MSNQSSATGSTISTSTTETVTDTTATNVAPTLKLRCHKPKNKKKVNWTETTVDNEHANKRKSKCCCVYVKAKEFGESSSESDGECEHCTGHVDKNKSTKMLRKKLKLEEQQTEDSEANIAPSVSITFEMMFWEKIWQLEQQLCEELKQIEFSKSDKNIGAIYNSLDYAVNVHKNYLKQFLKRSPKVLFLGMNPGINGMSQTGVPFGHVLTVKNWMGLSGHIGKPDIEIASKPVEGFDCTKEEPSGKRFWGLIQELCGQPENFFTNCFVHNICPFAFLHATGRNITPTEIKGPAKAQLNAVCLKYLAQSIEVFNPKIIISIGSYANDRIKDLKKKNLISEQIDCKLLAHPSPRALNNTDWVDKARKWYQENDIIKYFNKERQ